MTSRTGPNLQEVLAVGPVGASRDAHSGWGAGGHLRRRLLPQFGWAAIALVVGFAVLWPIIQLELRALADGGSAFARMIDLPRFGNTLWTTFILAVASSVLAVVLGTTLALCAARLPRQVRSVGQLLPLVPLMVPAVAAVTGWVFLLSPRVGYLNIALRSLPFMAGVEEGPFDIYTLPWIVIITALLLSSFAYLFVHTGLQNMGQEQEAAAAASGASPLRRLFTITLPLLRPSIIFAAGVVFLLGMGQFTVPLLLGRTPRIDVITTEMFYLTERYPIDYGLGAALGSPVLLIGIVLVALQKIGLGEQRRYVVVSARARLDERTTSWWAAAVVFFFGAVTTILPLLALGYVSLSPFWAGKLSVADLTLRNYQDVFANPAMTQAIWTSIRASFIAVAIVIVLGFACATALLNTTRVLKPIRAAIDLLVTLPLAIPASLMGFGLLFAYTGPPLPLYGTTAVIVVAYVTLMIGHSTRLQFTTLVATGQEFREASMTCGAGPLRTLGRIMLPLARKGIGASAALTFVLLFHEFSASMMVRSTRTQVIGSVMYDVWTGSSYPQVAVLALTMVAVTALGVLAAAWVGGVDSLKRG